MPRTIDPVVTAFGSVAQPTFELGDGLILRPFGFLDESIVRAAFSSPDIVRWHHFRVDTEADAVAWIERTHAKWVQEESADWLIEEGGVGVGRVGFHADALRGNAEIAYWLLPSGRGRGLVTSAAYAVTEWAHDLRFHRVVLQHSLHNPASCAVAARLGYSFEGTARQQDLHVDGWHDMHQHAHVAGDSLTRTSPGG
ncbi:MAG: GNAT family N-acetyltransferase [Ilumatobacter sp.]|uniref:GNAT family N-acetyltransferase n=1 Tax=Ilumatobacter sp. TaxID=1967498 RepID=UPI003297086A